MQERPARDIEPAQPLRTSATLKMPLQQQQHQAQPLVVYADTENELPAPRHTKATNDLQFPTRKAAPLATVQPRAPLVDLPPTRQTRSSNGPAPTDRVVPVKAGSLSPPDQHHFPTHSDQPLAPPPTAPLPAPPVVTAPAPPAAPVRKATHVWINGKEYLRSALLGKGGSSRVFRITDRDHNVFAMKRVELGKGDLETYTSFCNEIELLKRLRGHERIIQLVDAEVNEARRTLVMVRALHLLNVLELSISFDRS